MNLHFYDIIFKHIQKDYDMPTKLRVDLAGYHHVINRSVNRAIIFNTPNDKEIITPPI